LTDSADKKLRSIRIAVWILAVLVVSGTVVFYLLGRPSRSLFDAMWMTAQILTTVGDTGYERTRPEQVWSMVLMGVGVLAVFYLGINVVAFVVDGELREILGRRQLESRIKKVKNHFIICGFGRMGRALAEALHKKGAKFVVIDTDEKAMFSAAELGYLHLRGDAMSEELLEAAQIREARGLASCLPEDSNNVFAALTARDLNRDLHIVAKGNYEESHNKLRRAGADHVLSPSKLAADRALTKFMLPAVDELMEIVVHGPDLEVSKVALARLPGAIQKPLSEVALPKKTNLIVVAVVHEDGTRSFNPSPDTVMEGGDELIVIGPEGGVSELVEHFGHE
jgi:voltage-gated potassium channel